MGDGKIHVYFIFLRPFLFEISQRRKEEPKHVFRETVPEKGRMDGYTQGISQSTWGGWGPGLSSELLSCFTHWITLVQWVKFALWWSYSSSSCGQTNSCSLEGATSEPRPRGGLRGQVGRRASQTPVASSHTAEATTPNSVGPRHLPECEKKYYEPSA